MTVAVAGGGDQLGEPPRNAQWRRTRSCRGSGSGRVQMSGRGAVLAAPPSPARRRPGGIGSGGRPWHIPKDRIPSDRQCRYPTPRETLSTVTKSHKTNNLKLLIEWKYAQLRVFPFDCPAKCSNFSGPQPMTEAPFTDAVCTLHGQTPSGPSARPPAPAVAARWSSFWWWVVSGHRSPELRLQPGGEERRRRW